MNKIWGPVCWADIACVALMLVLLWVPDINCVTALSYTQDKFLHMDLFAAGAGLGYAHGLTPSLDSNANYGALIPAIFASISKWMGGVNYNNFFTITMVGGILYFIGCYVFLRVWFKNIPLAILGVFTALHVQMFHAGVAPLIWRFPSATEVRYFFDLAFLYFLWRHTQSHKSRDIGWAAAVCGLMLACVFEVGVYLTLSLGVYLAALWVTPQCRNIRRVGSWVMASAIIPVVAAVVMMLFLKGAIFQSAFWTNNTEFTRFFLAYYGAMPMTESLSNGHWLAFTCGFLPVVIYALTAMVVGALVFLGMIHWRHLFVVALCVYGLGIYHYYVFRSAITSYCVVAVPAVLVCCFWLKIVVERYWAVMSNKILWPLAVGAIVVLFFNPLFRDYPNVLNLSHRPWQDTIAEYRQHTDVSEDAKLISSLTGPQDRVALVSSLDVKILMEAKRAPFFYYTPLVYPRPFETLDFGGTEIFTTTRLKRILGSLQTASPEYVFVEKKLFLGMLPAVYYTHYETLTILMRYLSEHYMPDKSGKYLLALKRKI